MLYVGLRQAQTDILAINCILFLKVRISSYYFVISMNGEITLQFS